ncbi:MAG: beta-glucuronidase [Brevinema sp.]
MLYPIMTESRQVLSLNGIWKFKLDENQNLEGKGFSQKWFEKPLENTLNMVVPASFNDLHEGVDFRDHVGWMWYETEVSIPASLLKERLILRLDAATHTAKVYVNGKLATEHKGGFVPFEVLVNDFMVTGKNRITVAVNNVLDWTTIPAGGYKDVTLENGKIIKVASGMPDFFNYAGLQRSVRLYTTPKTYIKDIEIDTKIDGTVDYAVFTEGVGNVSVEILDESGKSVAQGSGEKGSIKVSNPTLWEPGAGYMYTMRVDFDGDIYEEPFGIRTVEVKEGKFLINNKPFYFKGFGKHEDAHVNGRGLNEVMYLKDFSLMKWINANSFRTSHYPYSEEMMRLADKEGIVVINECGAVGVHMGFGFSLMGSNEPKKNTWEHIQTMPQHRQAMEELVKRDKNHPSVVMWSLSNESATEEIGAKEYHQKLYDLTRALDPQKRPITIVTHMMSTPDKCQVADIVDVLALNRYYGWYVLGGELDRVDAALSAEMDAWTKRCPNKPIMFTEYGADTVAGMHDTTPVMFTEEYQVACLDANHKVLDRYPHFIGEQIWNFADFATSQGIFRVQGNKKGVFTRDRKPKLIAHHMKDRWAKISDFNHKK